MLEVVRSHMQPQPQPLQQTRIARYEAAWDDLDEAHAAIWDAVSHLFPPHAMVDQTDYGCLVVSWSLREGGRHGTHFAAPVIIRIAPGLLLALWTCDEESRGDIAQLQVETVSEALEDYDPYSRIATRGAIELGE